MRKIYCKKALGQKLTDLLRILASARISGWCSAFVPLITRYRIISLISAALANGEKASSLKRKHAKAKRQVGFTTQ